MNANPMSKPKSDYEQTIQHISLPDSPVGIDAQLTHAIIIDYLQQIVERLDKLEARLG
jgi:hypothetical protein